MILSIMGVTKLSFITDLARQAKLNLYIVHIFRFMIFGQKSGKKDTNNLKLKFAEKWLIRDRS